MSSSDHDLRPQVNAEADGSLQDMVDPVAFVAWAESMWQVIC